jgi:hypothetical protein
MAFFRYEPAIHIRAGMLPNKLPGMALYPVRALSFGFCVKIAICNNIVCDDHFFSSDLFAATGSHHPYYDMSWLMNDPKSASGWLPGNRKQIFHIDGHSPDLERSTLCFQIGRTQNR